MTPVSFSSSSGISSDISSDIPGRIPRDLMEIVGGRLGFCEGERGGEGAEGERGGRVAGMCGTGEKKERELRADVGPSGGSARGWMYCCDRVRWGCGCGACSPD